MPCHECKAPLNGQVSLKPMHVCVCLDKQDVAGRASTAEPRVGLTCIHQLFASSSVNASASPERGSQAAGGAAAGAQQQPGAEPAQAAGDAAQQNGGGAEQEPPTVEGLQSELQAQRAAAEEQEAQVGYAKFAFTRLIGRDCALTTLLDRCHLSCCTRKPAASANCNDVFA